MKRVLVRAPSNIAVIKYMGKLDASLNLPANPSLSLTLDQLCSVTEAVWSGPGEFSLRWQGASELGEWAGLRPMAIEGEKALQKMKRHIARVASALRPEIEDLGAWEIRSGNRFPAGAGIASSASGFAALTLAVAAALDSIAAGGQEASRLSQLSRQGSGSSCRSFEGPWVAWEGERAFRVASPSLRLADLVLLVDDRPKAVGSSEAHARVRESGLWPGRMERVESRYTEMRGILEADLLGSRWTRFAELCLEEAMDMHGLFHSSKPPFTYMTEHSREVLHWLEDHRELPVAITMDAGPNIHLLVPAEDVARVRRALEQRFDRLSILQDQQGPGALAGVQA
jgi:diphosphomevalonate decarboxylase